MRLEKVRIQNFRSCKDIEFPLRDFTVFVGYNNAGKSNVLQAIQWLIRPAKLSEKDFYARDKDVVVHGKITGIDETVLDSLPQNQRTAMTEYVHDGSLFVMRRMDHNNLANAGITLWVGVPADGDFESCEWSRNPTGIPQALGILFPEPIAIPAMSDAAEDVTKTSNRTTIGQIIGKIIQGFKNQHEGTIEESLSAIREMVDIDGGSRPPELERIDDIASSSLRDIFPGIDVKVHLEMPTVEDLFKKASVKTVEAGSVRDVETLGHGTQRSIQMALLRGLSILSIEAAQHRTTLLLVEEPELFLHPHAVELSKSALKRLADSGYQVIVVTHSPFVVDRDTIADTVLIRKDEERGTYANRTLKEQVEALLQDSDAQWDTLFSLSNSSQFLFSERVLLVEGKTERQLVPELYKHLTGQTLLTDRVAVVPVDGVESLLRTMQILDAIGLQAQAIADLDFAFGAAAHAGITAPSTVEGMKDLFRTQQARYDYLLRDDGLPKKGNGRAAHEVYELIASIPEAQPLIEQATDSLMQHQVWIWKRGTIESHLGLQGKGHRHSTELMRKLKNDGLDAAVEDPQSIKDLIERITSTASTEVTEI